MNESNARYHLRILKKKYLRGKLIEVFLSSLAFGFLAWGLLTAITGSAQATLFASAAMISFFVLLFLLKKLHLFHDKKLISYINQHYVSMEDSADLLTKDPSDLTPLQQLQQYRAVRVFEKIYPTIRFPQQLPRVVSILAVSVVAAFALSSVDLKRTGQQQIDNITEQGRDNHKVPLPPSVRSIRLTVVPPGYTGLQKFVADNPNVTVPEGSTIHWTIIFSDSVHHATVMFAENALALAANENQYTVSRRFTASTFYQLQWRSLSGQMKSSDYYSIQVVPDRAPHVAVLNLDQSVEVSIHDRLQFELKSAMNDDYDIRDAYVVATVSKGSGESVKFREEKLPFSAPSVISGKNVEASRTLDLMKLGLEPGDELYFYAEAIDNKQPVPNRSRTETYFITLKDTASQSLSVEGGLGVDLMPDYFRSQRQIIIDTEKLLKDKKRISKHDFNAKSNELGYDQKVLRLKYGEFLGEEFETRIGEAEEALSTEEGEEEDLTKKYAHTHDQENEHNLVPDKKQPAGEQHDHEGEEDDKEKSLMDAYAHQHDDAEEATFFNQSIRTKLKAALTEMWDAELYLRLYQPEKSLPYQYKALKLLKEISNDSRIYVHKTGFDPPPLKEEKRLTGDLADIRNSRHESNEISEETYPAIRTALQLIETRLQVERPKFSAAEKSTLNEAGLELSGIVLEKPGQFLASLTLIKDLKEDEIRDEDMHQALKELQKTFWMALPDLKTSAGQKSNTIHTLDRAFIKNLEDLKQ